MRVNVAAKVKVYGHCPIYVPWSTDILRLLIGLEGMPVEVAVGEGPGVLVTDGWVAPPLPTVIKTYTESLKNCPEAFFIFQ